MGNSPIRAIFCDKSSRSAGGTKKKFWALILWSFLSFCPFCPVDPSQEHRYKFRQCFPTLHFWPDNCSVVIKMPPKKLKFQNTDDLISMLDAAPSDYECSELNTTTVEETEEDEGEATQSQTSRDTLMRQIAQKRLKAKGNLPKLAVNLKKQDSDSSAYDYSDSEAEVTFHPRYQRKRAGSAVIDNETPKKAARPQSPLALPGTSKPSIQGNARTSTPSRDGAIPGTSSSTPCSREAPSPDVNLSPIVRTNDIDYPSSVDDSGEEADDEFLEGEGEEEEESALEDEERTVIDDEDETTLVVADPRPLANYAGDRHVERDTAEGWLDPREHVVDTAPTVPPFQSPHAGEFSFNADDFKPIDYFYEMFPRSLFQDIATETNRYHASGRTNRKHGK